MTIHYNSKIFDPTSFMTNLFSYYYENKWLLGASYPWYSCQIIFFVNILMFPMLLQTQHTTSSNISCCIKLGLYAKIFVCSVIFIILLLSLCFVSLFSLYVYALIVFTPFWVENSIRFKYYYLIYTGHISISHFFNINSF